MKQIFNSSIARSLLGGFCLFMVPVIAFSMVLNARSVETARKEIVYSYMNSVSLLDRHMNDRLRGLVNVIDSLTASTDVIYLNFDEYNEKETLLSYAELIEKLKFYSRANLLNCKIKIFFKNNGRSVSSSDGLDYINEGDRNAVLELPPSLTDRWRLEGGSLSFIRNPVYSRSKTGIVGMISIDSEEVTKFLQSLNVSNYGGKVFLLSPEGNWAFADKDSILDKDRVAKEISAGRSDYGQFVYSNGSEDYRTIYVKSQMSGLVLGMYFPEKYAMRSIADTGKWMLAFFITAILLAVLFSWIVYKKLLWPFNSLVAGMREVSKGDFTTRIDKIPDDDFGFVIKQFNRMVSNTESLINDVYIARINQHNAQLKLLQSRINPHFLYNCLNFIYQMSMGEDNEGAAKMALYLGKYFRFMAKCNRELLTLKEECDNVNTYLEIQAMRFQGRIRYRMDIPPEHMDIHVPSLIIQPLVENAIVHGLKDIRGGIFINIFARLENGKLKIAVEDDGNTVPRERLKEIRVSLDRCDGEEMGSGLNNTHLRLKLKYGEESGITIENTGETGVRVTMNIDMKGAGSGNV